MIRFVVIALLATGCSMLRTDYVIVREFELPAVRQCLTIEAAQDSISYNVMDLGRALVSSSLSGIGLGLYESRIFYGGRAFPTERGPVMDWFREPRDGDAWFKFLASDKLSRSLWQAGAAGARQAWHRFFAGNWLLAYIADFIVTNTIATVVRSYGKYGRLQLDFGFTLPGAP